MSVFTLEADIRRSEWHVRLVPKADLIASRRLSACRLHRDRLRSTNQKHHSLMACCASSRPLLDGFFSRSAASFASRSLRKRSVLWARSSRSSSCSSFNERFVGALGFFSIVAPCDRCARFIGALGFFSVASCSRFVG